LLFNIVSDEHKAQCAEILLDPTRSPPMRAGYMNFYMVEALFSLGLNKEALDRMREYWGGMLERGASTFWETYDPDTPDGTIPERLWSLCHEFCAGPVYSLPAHVAGIKALAPGFQRVEIAPHLEDLAWINAQVPTPKGVVKVLAQRTSDTKCVEFEIDIPPEVSAEILAPLPGRDIGTVYVDNKPVSSGMNSNQLCSIRSNLFKVSRKSTSLRLSFGASHSPEHIRIATQKTHLFPSDWKIVDVLYQPWEE